MKEYEVVQAGGVLISILLVATFYMLLLLGILSKSDVLVHLILITIAIVNLAVYSEVFRIGYTLRKGKK
jgi:hypothetical protein